MKVYSLVLCALIVLIGAQVDCVAGSRICQLDLDPCLVIRCCDGFVCSGGVCKLPPPPPTTPPQPVGGEAQGFNQQLLEQQKQQEMERIRLEMEKLIQKQLQQ